MGAPTLIGGNGRLSNNRVGMLGIPNRCCSADRFSGVTSPPPPGPQPAVSPAPRPTDEPRWGLGEALVGLILSQVAAGVVASVLLLGGDWDSMDDAPMWVTALATLALQATLAAVAVWATVNKGFGLVRDFAVRVAWSDVGTGVLLGVLAQLVLVPAVTFPLLWLTDTDVDEVSRSARELTDRATTPVGVVSLVIAVGVVAPIVEEVFFRGLLFGAFKKRDNLFWRRARNAHAVPDAQQSARDRRQNVLVAGIASSVIFGLIHFQPLLIPALSAVGGLFAWLAHRYGRLGPAIWAHAGFNMTTLLSLLT